MIKKKKTAPELYRKTEGECVPWSAASECVLKRRCHRVSRSRAEKKRITFTKKAKAHTPHFTLPLNQKKKVILWVKLEINQSHFIHNLTRSYLTMA